MSVLRETSEFDSDIVQWKSPCLKVRGRLDGAEHVSNLLLFCGHAVGDFSSGERGAAVL